ncbi:MAG: polysulfide reductase NrfD [Holophagaceae bacterium]|nr:polysulfide reductase NrfD [Holophagaceae bacterium]
MEHGFFYPNEAALYWSVLITLYPFITGLVAGAFILASLVNVFRVEAIKPAYRLALLTAMAFLIAAPIPLQAHLGHPLRAWEIMVTPNPKSAMAMFGFVYLWYLMAVLVLEMWFEYRADFVRLGRGPGLMGRLYRTLSLGVDEDSPDSILLDERISRVISVIGIPSAILLHGYVGFIFGSIKANPWWSSPIMPIIFIFSAMVSGIAAVMLIYWAVCRIKKVPVDIHCLDAIGTYLCYTFIIDFVLEALDFIHRIYEADESFDILSLLMQRRLFVSQFIVQFLIGTLVPILILLFLQLRKPQEALRRKLLLASATLTLVGIYAMRWNVVIGGQMYSKSFRGFTTWKLDLIGGEGILVAILVACLPLLFLWLLLKFFAPFHHTEAPPAEAPAP